MSPWERILIAVLVTAFVLYGMILAWRSRLRPDDRIQELESQVASYKSRIALLGQRCGHNPVMDSSEYVTILRWIETHDTEKMP